MATDDAEEAGDDPAALDRLVEEHLPRLRAYVRCNVPPDLRARESCSDLVQSVCRELIGRRERFDFQGPEAFRAWLFRWALNKIKDRARYYRADKRDATLEQLTSDNDEIAALYESLGTPSAMAIRREQTALLEQALDQLSADDRQVVSLCRIAGLSREEAATIMGKSVGAVRTHLNRALVRLAGALDRLGVHPRR